MIKLNKILEEKEIKKEKFQLDILPGDIILGGKFRNHPYVIASFGKDKNNQPIIITDKGKELPFLSVRIKKLMSEKEKKMIKFNEILDSEEEDENVIKNILNKYVEYRESILKIRKYLQEKGLENKNLTDYEIYSIWEIFSDEEFMAQFLHVDDKTLDDFYKWIQEKQND
jgi:hypothetical protein